MLTIIGCGNLNRCDDGIGVLVAQALQTRLRDDFRQRVRIFDAGTGGMDVMFQARGAHRLIIVDAARSGAEPGAVFQVPGEELSGHPEPGYSLHDFRWDHALYAGRRIFREAFPQEVSVYLIESACLELGVQISEPVKVAGLKVVAMIEREIAAYAGA
ncbi:hydrogenase maturation protease [Solimonas aquatica]|uniref:Hydrogenase maturation protease n=1 Tax=Solimonas aquatica TaxID=489703 RepID=A0A1H9FWR7_9GAMM|nr:hydrogenase maturation protease [Solimonas aquatica]SEQ42366.1 hydrogenase maturation protease [Solimonas aquatica]